MRNGALSFSVMWRDGPWEWREIEMDGRVVAGWLVRRNGDAEVLAHLLGNHHDD